MLHHICPRTFSQTTESVANPKFSKYSKPLSLTPVNQMSVCHTNSSPVDSFSQTIMRL